MSLFIDHIESSLKQADMYKSKITDEILKMQGMSGLKTRHFYNNLCSMNNARYLEIGTWKGSSICSAMCNNKMTCVAIDNWSEFGGPKMEFLNNFNKYKGNNDANFIEKNCWDIDVKMLGKFNIYMYDGNHDEDSHYKALNHYLPVLDQEFIYLVDDWNYKHIEEGTMKSISDNKLNILYQKVILTPGNPGIQSGNYINDWHDGISIFVLRK
jgi:hypothetical protein